MTNTTTYTETNRELPILMSDLMAQKILHGLKWQTRRVLKFQPDFDSYYLMELERRGTDLGCVINYNQGDKNPFVKCPYGDKGDWLYVRETHFRLGHWLPNGETKAGKQKWKFESVNNKVYFNDSMETEFISEKRYLSRAKLNPEGRTLLYKRSGLFMPRELSRIWLKKTATRVERLQDITERDAIAEGCTLAIPGAKQSSPFSATTDFKILWDKINGEGSWDKNPWVWVNEFQPHLAENMSHNRRLMSRIKLVDNFKTERQ